MKQENSDIGKKVLTDGLDLGYQHVSVSSTPEMVQNLIAFPGLLFATQVHIKQVRWNLFFKIDKQ